MEILAVTNNVLARTNDGLSLTVSTMPAVSVRETKIDTAKIESKPLSFFKILISYGVCDTVHYSFITP